MSSSVQGLGSRRTIQLIAGREIKFRLASKAFIWTTVAFVAAVVAGGVLLNLVGSNQSAKQIGYTPAAASITDTLAASAAASGLDVETTPVATQAAGESLLESGDIDALVTEAAPQLTVTVKERLDDSLAPLLTSLAQQGALANAVTALGGNPADVAADISRAEPVVSSLEPPPDVDSGQIVAGFVAGILLFIALMTAGQLVAQGVVEEKSSRVVELLLATVRPWQLMAGKVLGVGIVGLIQVVAVVVAGLGTALALGLVDASSVNLGSAAGWAIIWFVIGFACYALVLAGLASLVSRQEDVGSVIGPVTGLMIIPYVIGISIAPWAPDNPLVVWLSYIPFCSPMIMPIRIALGAVELWEILISIALSLAVIPVLVWLAGRVYSNAVLHTGGRVRLKDALRSG